MNIEHETLRLKIKLAWLRLENAKRDSEAYPANELLQLRREIADAYWYRVNRDAYDANLPPRVVGSNVQVAS